MWKKHEWELYLKSRSDNTVDINTLSATSVTIDWHWTFYVGYISPRWLTVLELCNENLILQSKWKDRQSRHGILCVRKERILLNNCQSTVPTSLQKWYFYKHDSVQNVCCIDIKNRCQLGRNLNEYSKS